MARATRNSLITAKIESTYGTDPTPTGADNAILVSNLTPIKINANNVNRDLVRPYLGGSEQLFGSAFIELSFDVELAGAGTAGAVPAYGPLLRACAFDEDDQVAYVAYTPISDISAFESITIYYYADGELHKLLGARGTVVFKANVGERPVMSFKFLGLDGGKTATALASPTYTTFKAPIVVSDPNTGNVTLGCTESAGVLSGGTSYTSKGLEMDVANALNFTPLLGGESIDVTQREVQGKVMFDLTAAQAVTFYTNVKANTTQAIGLSHGTTAGYKWTLFMPSAQLVDMAQGDTNGRIMYDFGIRAIPSSGNDELKLVVF